MTQNTSLEPSVNGLYVGEIRLLPFRHDELPFGWHFCNGERFLLTSAQGEILSSLSENFRADWGLEEDLCSISLPNLFYEDGRGCFLRPVDGVTRQVGVVQGDAIRNIQGLAYGGGGVSLFYYNNDNSPATMGAFNLVNGNGYYMPCKAGRSYDLTLDASRVVPTAEENRPLNLGMTPAIYLGV